MRYRVPRACAAPRQSAARSIRPAKRASRVAVDPCPLSRGEVSRIGWMVWPEQ